MEVYLVGGCVRDALLNRPSQDRDWVVVGATPDAMLAAGFTQVGRDFPVFLHPQTHEEYALARTERKVGAGHQGFVCHAGVEVTLDEDLKRRDLTINAIAQRPDGSLVDPFNGQRDLAARQLRHVSPAFVEDPLRVFRVARFASQLPGFAVAPATQELMRELVEADELAALSAERVWQELAKALMTEQPGQFFSVLSDCGGLRPWLVEFESPQQSPAQLDFGAVPAELDARFAWLCTVLTASEARALGARLRAPKHCLQLALQLLEHRQVLGQWQRSDARDLCASLAALGAFRPAKAGHGGWPHAVVPLLSALENQDLTPLAEVVALINEAVTSAQLMAQGLSGPALGEALTQAREAVLQDWLGTRLPP